MEAKVDVRKLQILNDRINQTIDALNQVRFSVHGLGHTGVPSPMLNPFAAVPQGYGVPTPFLGVPPIPPVPGFLPFPGPLGLQHTPFTPPLNPLFPTPYTNPLVNPMLQTQGTTPSWGVPPTPWMGFGGGLLHSPVEPIDLRLFENKVLDPTRIFQTFPYISY